MVCKDDSCYIGDLLIIPRNRVNKEGQFVYVKYHFICDQGSEQFTPREAIQICGEP